MNAKTLITIVIASLLIPAIVSHARTDNTITFDNQSGQPAFVKLVGPMQRDVEVPVGQKRTVTASSGQYHIKTRYGTPGRYRYTKGDEFIVKDTATSRSEITITLHKVIDGNYETIPISEAQFAIANLTYTSPEKSPVDASQSTPQGGSVTSAQLVLRSGLYYLKDEKTPFSGTLIEHYPASDQIKLDGPINAGERDGIWKYWYPSGKKESEEHYSNGLVVKALAWYENGGRKHQTSFKNLKKHGTHMRWHEDGRLKSREVFDNGLLVSAEGRDQQGNVVIVSVPATPQVEPQETVDLRSWDLVESNDYEIYKGKKLRLSDLAVREIHATGKREVECVAYDPKNHKISHFPPRWSIVMGDMASGFEAQSFLKIILTLKDPKMSTIFKEAKRQAGYADEYHALISVEGNYENSATKPGGQRFLFLKDCEVIKKRILEY